ncbi:DTW domain-containing protein [Staphylococcus epidermidis]|nr:DTW domain-containing protein [Staphylococcus epidermidis]
MLAPDAPVRLRALRTCVCPLAQAIEHQVEVLILMHSQEVHEAKGTGHLLHLCLPHSRILVGENSMMQSLGRHCMAAGAIQSHAIACCSTPTPRSKIALWAWHRLALCPSPGRTHRSTCAGGY